MAIASRTDQPLASILEPAQAQFRDRWYELAIQLFPEWQQDRQSFNLALALTQNTIDSELVETIVALPNDLPIKKHTLQNLNIKQEQMLQQLREAAKKLEGQVSKEK